MARDGGGDGSDRQGLGTKNHNVIVTDWLHIDDDAKARQGQCSTETGRGFVLDALGSALVLAIIACPVQKSSRVPSHRSVSVHLRAPLAAQMGTSPSLTPPHWPDPLPFHISPPRYTFPCHSSQFTMQVPEQPAPKLLNHQDIPPRLLCIISDFPSH